MKKTHTLRIFQNEKTSIEDLIQKIVDFGYEYDDTLSESFSYKRSGGVLSIVQENTQEIFHIEWFDDEIDSIIHLDTASDDRKFVSQVALQNPKKQEVEHSFLQ